MPGWIIDIVLLLIVAIIAWCVSSEGVWGAALLFVNLMISGLVAFSYYEPAATFIDRNVHKLWGFNDFLCLVILFSIVFVVVRLGTDSLAPLMLRFPAWLNQVGRAGFGVATGWYATGMILCMLETAPIHKQFLGYRWEDHAFWGVGIDRHWLGYVQWSTGRIFAWHWNTRFDRRADFIIRYHNARPFGEPDPKIAGGAAAGASAPTEGGAAPAGDTGAGTPTAAPATKL
jgi:hypothetical protein